MPADHIAAAAAAHGRLRASHADREQVIGVLKTAFVQGRLTKDEFGTRVGQAFTSRTYAELTEVTADLPAGLEEAQEPCQLASTRPRLSMNAAFSAGAFGMLAALVGMLAAIASRSEIGVLTAAGSIAIILILTFAAAMTASWLGRGLGEHAKRRAPTRTRGAPPLPMDSKRTAVDAGSCGQEH